MTDPAVRAELSAYWETLTVNNTHCHHLTDDWFTDASLHKLIAMSYNSWICPPYADDDDGWAFYFDRMGVNSYAYWLTLACGKLYGDGTRLCEENRAAIAEAVRAAYAEDPKRHEKLLSEVCHYDHIVLDDYMAPGSTHGIPGVRPTFRTDMFLFGCSRTGTDENHNCAWNYFETPPATLDQYVAETEKSIVRKIRENGSRSLKLAIAYERGLDFSDFDRDKAEAAFLNPDATDGQKRAFADYVVDQLCTIAAKYGIPYQIHTGLGQLHRTNAMSLLPLIRRHKDTKFVLFHCSFPWTDDALALTHNFGNVYPDLCWLPLLSPAEAEQFLARALDVTDAHRLTWGCDTWTGEESYGALLAIRSVLTNVLSRRVTDGYYTLDYAKRVGKNILHDNAERIYGFKAARD